MALATCLRMHACASLCSPSSRARAQRVAGALIGLLALTLSSLAWAHDGPKLVFSDLDETLRSSESPTLGAKERRHLEAITKKVDFTVVTGSQWHLAEPKLNELGVAIHRALVGGGEILMRRVGHDRWQQDVSHTSRLLEQAGGFSGKAVHRLLEPLLHKAEFRKFVLQGADSARNFALFQSWDASRRDYLAARLWLPAEGRDYEAVKGPIDALLAEVDAKLRAKGVRAQYTYGAHDKDRDVYAVDIKPADKGMAARLLAEHEGVSSRQVVVAGNALNDTEFTGRLVDLQHKDNRRLESVSAFVAPGDARPELVGELKKLVKHIRGPQRVILAEGSCPQGTIAGLRHAVGLMNSPKGLKVLHNRKAQAPAKLRTHHPRESHRSSR